MRIAIPSIDEQGLESQVAEHFGKAPFYTFVDVDLENKKILNYEVVKVPFESHNPGDLPLFIKEHDGELVMAYGMGVRAKEFFSYMRIKVLTGISGKINKVINSFLSGKIHEIINENWENTIKKSH